MPPAGTADRSAKHARRGAQGSPADILPTGNRERVMEELQQLIAYAFRDDSHLLEALTHSSYANEVAGEPVPDNERLEYLGDAVLGLAAATHLSGTFPEAREGELSRLRASLVDQRSLAAAARSLSLGPFLRLGRGEERSGGREKDSILAGAAEALIGSVFRDGGWMPAFRLALRYFEQAAAGGSPPRPDGDPKTRLQELCQEKTRTTPRYSLLERRGPDHSPSFTVAVFVGEEEVAVGRGANKKEAEQAAASAAIELLNSDSGGGR